MDMDIQCRKMFETFLVGLRDEIVGTLSRRANARQKRQDFDCQYVAEWRLERRFPDDLDLLDKREKIRAIDKALARLRTKTYNICERCGGTISEKRLKETMLPWPTRCRKCETAERKRTRPRQNDQAGMRSPDRILH